MKLNHPPHPKIGESITIIGEVYNAGKSNVNSVASIVTIAYFIDDELLHIDNIGNIEPGIANTIKTSSGPVWKSEAGEHTVKVIINYQNTLKEEYDSPDDNILEKTFVVEFYNPTKITLNAHPQYGISEIEKMMNFTASPTDRNTNMPLNGEETVCNLNEEKIKQTTNKQGENLFSNTNHFFDTIMLK